jgi:hypothetical protein
MSKKIVESLKSRANNLMHRNIKQKDELMLDVKNFLTSKKYPRDVYDAFNLIIFEYTEMHQLHNGKTDEQWKKGKASLIKLLEKL